MTVEERYQHLEDTVRAYNPTASFDKIRAAYEFAAAAHQRNNMTFLVQKGQLRFQRHHSSFPFFASTAMAICSGVIGSS